MSYDPARHHRRSIRIPWYDYRNHGGYFITICVRNRECIFGTVAGDTVRLTQRGHIVNECWHDIPNHHANASLDEFIIMPNHVHGVLFLIGNRATQTSPLHNATAAVGATPASPSGRPRGATSGSLGAVLGSFKSAVSRRINQLRPGSATKLWQPNYYEHVIRNESSLQDIREYIFTNPLRWPHDAENPDGDATDRFHDRIVEIDRRHAPRASGEQGDAGVAPTQEGSNV